MSNQKEWRECTNDNCLHEYTSEQALKLIDYDEILECNTKVDCCPECRNTEYHLLSTQKQ